LGKVLTAEVLQKASKDEALLGYAALLGIKS
jgi:hypothetical protein